MAMADIHYFVQMKVNAQESELTIKTGRKEAGGCPAGKRKGCIKANQGDEIKFSFLLAGNTKCSEADDARWKLSEVLLGGKDSGSKPDANGWGGFTNDAEVTSDFDFADAATGKLAPTATLGDRQMTFEDRNGYEYDIWYLVKADCVDGEGTVLKTISVDPRVINKGKL